MDSHKPHVPGHSWIDVPAHTNTNEHHRVMTIEYPQGLLNGTFTPSDPACPSGDAAITGPTACFVVFPGNPGLCQFYENFARHLLQGGIPGLCVVVVSHAGFSMPSRDHHHHGKVGGVDHRHHPSSSSNHNHSSKKKKKHHHQHHDRPNSKNIDEDGGPFLLQQQLVYLESFLKNFVETNIVQRFSIPRERCWLMGHSIGSWFGLHIYDKFAHLFSRVVLLAPTIARMNDSDNGNKMRTLLHYGKHFVPQLAGIFHSAFRLSGLHNIVELVVGKELHASDIHTVKEMLGHTRVTRQIMHLASDELRKVNEPMPAVLGRVQKAVICYFCWKDEWVPEALREDIRAQHPNLAGFHIEQDRSVLHNWTLACHVVADFCVGQFKAYCKSEEGAIVAGGGGAVGGGEAKRRGRE